MFRSFRKESFNFMRKEGVERRVFFIYKWRGGGRLEGSRGAERGRKRLIVQGCALDDKTIYCLHVGIVVV